MCFFSSTQPAHVRRLLRKPLIEVTSNCLSDFRKHLSNPFEISAYSFIESTPQWCDLIPNGISLEICHDDADKRAIMAPQQH